MKYDENILLEAWKRRVAALPEDTQRQLEEYRKADSFTDELVPIKRKRPKLEAGDVFVVQPIEGLYFYGRVLKANVDVFFRGGGGGGPPRRGGPPRGGGSPRADGGGIPLHPTARGCDP
ncbi:MAG: hypothetical protein FWG23_05860, partial [Eggerthellaceae bacterium]|nr:hypothetical protein [Eggerthellaceae bacterium]